jgi:hypothetical protein
MVVVVDVTICAGRRILVILGNIAATPSDTGAMRIPTVSLFPVIACTVVPVNICTAEALYAWPIKVREGPIGRFCRVPVQTPLL